MGANMIMGWGRDAKIPGKGGRIKQIRLKFYIPLLKRLFPSLARKGHGEISPPQANDSSIILIFC
jgi:hypothetical protein